MNLFFFTLKKIKVQLIYSIVPISAIQPRNPVIHIHTFFFSYYLPSWSISRAWIEFPVLYSGTSLLIHSKWESESCFFFSPVFLEPHLQHMEVPRLGVKLELQLRAYATATATIDAIRLCNLYHSSQQHQILNPLSEVRDRTCVLMVTSWVRYH